MPLYSPQSQAGITSFYDAQTNGPKIEPKLILAAVVVLTLAILIVDHFIYFA